MAAPLASGISICGVSAAIATGGAIRARSVVPVMVSSLVSSSRSSIADSSVCGQHFLYHQPLVAGAWMALSVKTDGQGSQRCNRGCAHQGKASGMLGINYQPGGL